MTRSARFSAVFRVATDGYEPYRWQERFALSDPLPRLVEAPTGSGKTEAGVMGWLWRRRLAGDAELAAATPRRLIIALPMRVLVEQTEGRIKRMIERLERSGHLLEGEVGVSVLLGGAAPKDWVLQPARDQVVVATVDMAVSRALNRGYARSRAAWPIDFGLINEDALWILDEVQLLDAALTTSVQLEVFRAEQRRDAPGAPSQTVWMSATLRSRWLRTVDHPAPEAGALLGIGPEDRSGALGKRLAAAKTLRRVQLDPDDDAAVAALALEAHRKGAPTGGEPPWLTIVLRNTVGRAAATFAAIGQHDPDAEVVLLHSRYRPPDRKRQLARLDTPPGPAGRIVVTTQVIEAGVDLDASALISDLCPWASLVQRAGRLNREGERRATVLRWIDPRADEIPAELARPYEPAALEGARALLRDLDGSDVSPDALRALADGAADALMTAPVTGLVLRRPDLRDLFDTDPTLDGDDEDVSAYIRLGEELDVQVAWREGPPASSDRAPVRDELCPIPLAHRKPLLARAPMRWSYADRSWERLTATSRLLPGDVLVLDSDKGGYDAERGWDPAAVATVHVIALPSETTVLDVLDGDDVDVAGTTKRWIGLVEHTDAVVAELERDIARLPLTEVEAEALRLAARWHDAGKAHPVQQIRFGADPRDPHGPWAKPVPTAADTRVADEEARRWQRRARGRFRHEVASVLLLEAHRAPSLVRDLALYLLGAHHGKLRVAPRLARAGEDDAAFAAVLGVRAGEAVPAGGGPIDLGGGVFAPPLAAVELTLFELGSLERKVWVELVEELVERHGVFRLAYLEGLLRVADHRASAEADGRLP